MRGTVVGIDHDLQTLSKKSVDGFQLHLRNGLKNHLDAAVGPYVEVNFTTADGQTISRVTCTPHPSPVYFRDGDRSEFYIRDGNQTVPLDIRRAHDYIDTNWAQPSPLDAEILQESIAEAIQSQLSTGTLLEGHPDDAPPALTQRPPGASRLAECCDATSARPLSQRTLEIAPVGAPAHCQPLAIRVFSPPVAPLVRPVPGPSQI